GSFFQGVFATVLATPCTAPFLGTALGFAFTHAAAIILALIIAIASGRRVPLQQFLGFRLLATLRFLLYVLGAERGLEGAIWASCFLLVISVACWMKGAFVLPTASAAKRSVVLMLIVMLVWGGGIYFIGGKFRSTNAALADSRLRGDWQAFTPERL